MTRSAIIFVVCTVLVACSSDNVSNDLSSSEKITVSSLTGFSQKGPFVAGSSIRLYELDQENLQQTGRSFSGKIIGNDGSYSFLNVALDSRYALIEASGYFLNEITGNLSNGPITLNAISDLMDRKNANVNLLTHLEYERVLYLVEKGNSFSMAKQQAESEVLSAFGIQGEFNSAEDLNIFGEEDENAALLAMSILLIRNLNEGEFVEELSKIALDIAVDGSWDDEATKREITEWLYWHNEDFDWPIIRSYIASWGFGTIPGFEKYLKNFRKLHPYFGECSLDAEGEVVTTLDDISALCENGNWRIGDKQELLMASLKECSKDREGEVLVKTPERTFGPPENPIEFVCKNGIWNSMTIESDTGKADVYDTFMWDSGKDGDCRYGNVSKSAYRYDSSTQKWEHSDELCWNYPKEIYLNPNLEYDSIVDDRDGKVYKTIKIGEQTWMAENLNYADSVNTPSLRGNSRCYDDDPKKCEVIGRLYTWMAAIDSVRLARDENLTLVCENNATCDSLSKKLKFTRGICPNGWHLPSSSESHKLFGKEDYEEEITGHLISSYAWNRFDFYHKDETNESGFSLIPYDRQFALFWETDDISSGLESMEIWLAGCDFHGLNLYCKSSGYGSYYSDRSLYPIRCIKD
ncbi:MAG: FISUMP domain-containing protein [Fibrobacter sp.]|nr:FISUMP domain-containing protein [Fibrobacter sp.]MDY6369681.1 FISUMP domain-containing protein [Fibrobacter sp.]MDY6389179.1 FISUMP domain-containing protein [Fibrobacter sp.]